MSCNVKTDHFLSIALPLIEQTLETFFPKKKTFYDALFQASRYALSGGKRLRPLLMLAVTEAFHVPMSKALYPACTLELIHSYSLIHDDLPCMDDDDFRRGKPSLHRAFPESHAVLTGDYLLTYSFEILCLAPELSSSEKLALVHSLSHYSGSTGMIGGQIMDIESKEKSLDMNSFLQMQMQKTSSLMTAALEFGAILAKRDPLPYKKIGEKIGLAFQICDDLSDAKQEKNAACNILFFLEEKKAREYVRKLYDETLDEIRSLSPSLILLEDLIRTLIFREV